MNEITPYQENMLLTGLAKMSGLVSAIIECRVGLCPESTQRTIDRGDRVYEAAIRCRDGRPSPADARKMLAAGLRFLIEELEKP